MNDMEFKQLKKTVFEYSMKKKESAFLERSQGLTYEYTSCVRKWCTGRSFRIPYAIHEIKWSQRVCIGSELV